MRDVCSFNKGGFTYYTIGTLLCLFLYGFSLWVGGIHPGDFRGWKLLTI